MRRIIYISKSKDILTDQDMLDILEVARTNNKGLDVTGILVRKRDVFFQILEGEESAVKSLYEKIEKDNRHCDVEIIDNREILERSFGEWEMAFTSLEDDERLDGIEGFSNVLQQEECDTQALKTLNEGEKAVALFRDTGPNTSKSVIRYTLR